MRAYMAGVLALALSTSSVMAASDVGTLPAGKPAGVKQADLFAVNPVYLVLGLAALGIIIGAAASAKSTAVAAAAGSTTTATTTTTSTS